MFSHLVSIARDNKISRIILSKEVMKHSYFLGVTKLTTKQLKFMNCISAKNCLVNCDRRPWRGRKPEKVFVLTTTMKWRTLTTTCLIQALKLCLLQLPRQSKSRCWEILPKLSKQFVLSLSGFHCANIEPELWSVCFHRECKRFCYPPH